MYSTGGDGSKMELLNLGGGDVSADNNGNYERFENCLETSVSYLKHSHC